MTIIAFNPFYQPIKSLLLGMKCVLEHQDLLIFGLRLYANGVHLRAVLENTALVQGIRCESLGKHLIPGTCAVFFIPQENGHRLYFLTRQSKIFNGR